MKILENYILRTPLLPYNHRDITNIFLEALYLTSPELYNELLKNKDRSSQKENKKLNVSIYKYLKRATTRCTPFGLFAGLSIGEWENKSEALIHSDVKQVITRKTRLDMNILCSLAKVIEKQDYVKPFIKYYPNNSIYKTGDFYRYIDYYYENTTRMHKLSQVGHNEYLELILNESATGKKITELVQLIHDDTVAENDALAFVNELINAQLLTSQLEPRVTGSDFWITLLNEIQSILRDHPSSELSELFNFLLEIDRKIKVIDANSVNPVTDYRVIHEELKNILPNITETNLFQTDLYKKKILASLSEDIQTSLNDAINFLTKVTPKNKVKDLEDFKGKFFERYELQQVPLLTALDAEIGIGYPVMTFAGENELIDDIIFEEKNQGNRIKWDKHQSWLHKLLIQGFTEGKTTIQITDKDLEVLDDTGTGLPHTFTVMFNVLNDNNKIHVSSIGGSSAINLLGRFAGADKDLHRILGEIAEFEQAQFENKILAEIVHLPESRTGNILSRPIVRNFEIPYLAKSSDECITKINVSDLYICIENDRILLFDKRLNKEIIPRMGNAHNFVAKSLPVYHFLCDMQTQYFEKPFLGFDWGVLANQYKFLPRVEYKNVVISPARWQLSKHDLVSFVDKNNTDEKKHELFLDLKEKFKLPDLFLLVVMDNTLLIDTNNQTAIDAFVNEVKYKPTVILEEFLFDTDRPYVKDTGGNGYTNECIAVFLNEYKVGTPTNKAKKEPVSRRNFITGSEWLYYKIYCGVKTTDVILSEKIKPLMSEYVNNEVLNKWFFIRYADPEPHIRLRVNFNKLNAIGEIIQRINTEFGSLVAQGIVIKLQTDTYIRELERYGDNTMEIAESLFYNDSIFVTGCLDLLDPVESGKIRWKLALRSTDEFLNNFGFDLEKKFNFITKLAAIFFLEFEGNGLKKQLDDKFRSLRPEIESILTTKNDEFQEFYPALNLLSERSSRNEEPIRRLMDIMEAGDLMVDLEELLFSYIHMNLDRLFISKNRMNEFVVYELLMRYYKSTIAKEKAMNKQVFNLSN